MSEDPAHRLYVHLAWSTRAGPHPPSERRRAVVESAVLASCRLAGTDPIEACVLADRIHALVRFPATLSIRTLERRVREAVEARLAGDGRVVRWAPGFAALTVAPRDVRRLRRRLATLGRDGGDASLAVEWRGGTGGAWRAGRRAGPIEPGRRRRAWPRRSSSPHRGSAGS